MAQWCILGTYGLAMRERGRKLGQALRAGSSPRVKVKYGG
jgi:hypothetical protein